MECRITVATPLQTKFRVIKEGEGVWKCSYFDLNASNKKKEGTKINARNLVSCFEYPEERDAKCYKA